TIDLPWFANQLLLGDDADLCADMDNNLVVDGRDIKNFVSAVLSGGVCPALDAWETPDADPAAGAVSFYAFGTADNPPIPAGFFGAGSNPFLGTVQWSPLPIDSSISPTDTIVRRPPLPPPPTTVPIELVELSLVSSQPITVNYSGGPPPEQWFVS